MLHVRMILIAATFAVAAAGAEDKDFTPLFNGKDLTGWEGDEKLWTVKDGVLIGSHDGLKHNSFLCTKETYGDFKLKLKFKLINKHGDANSGVQFRTKKIPNSHEVSGYQADIGEGYWGCLYDESRRNKILVKAPDELKEKLKKDDWNEYEIECKGSKIVMSINGLKTVDYDEPDATIPRDGIIALQVHSGKAMVIQFKDVVIQKLK